MKVIKPTPYNIGMSISTTLTESTPTYNSGTTYALGAQVVFGMYKYESLQNSNTNHQPDLLASSTWWLKIGSDNRYALFDGVVQQMSSKTTSFVHTLVIGSVVDTFAIINSNAVTVRLKITDTTALPSPVVVYDQTIGLSGVVVADWYDYYFADPTVNRTQVIFYDIPPYANAEFQLTFTGATGETVSAGEVVFGMLSDLGITQYGVTSGIIDYSVKSTDQYGSTTLTKRAYSKRMSAKVQLNNTQLNRVQSFLYAIRATPCVWIGSDDPRMQEPLVIYGFYKDFSTEIPYPTYSLCSLEIEGLT